MLSKGNSDIAVCVNNLLKTSRGEVPYERLKGVNFSLLDGPASTAGQEMIEDIEWMLSIYEPRAKVDGVQLIPDDAQNGRFTIKGNISTQGATDL